MPEPTCPQNPLRPLRECVERSAWKHDCSVCKARFPSAPERERRSVRRLFLDRLGLRRTHEHEPQHPTRELKP